MRTCCHPSVVALGLRPAHFQDAEAEAKATSTWSISYLKVRVVEIRLCRRKTVTCGVQGQLQLVTCHSSELLRYDTVNFYSAVPPHCQHAGGFALPSFCNKRLAATSSWIAYHSSSSKHPTTCVRLQHP